MPVCTAPNLTRTDMRPANMPDVLPSPAEVLYFNQYPLVRYTPPRTELQLQEQPNWENSEFPNHEVESEDARCGICCERYVPPKSKNSNSPETLECELLRKLPCSHAFHVRTSVYVQR